jgi:serine protease DegQ
VNHQIDLAVLKVPGLAAAAQDRFATVAPGVAIGEFVVSLGRPGQIIRAALGLASAVSAEPWRTPAGGRLAYYLEVDGNLPEGFSGGALLSTAGQVLGMNTIAMPRGTGMTVPVADIASAIAKIARGATTERWYLGVNSVPVPTPTGLMVTEVEPGSPANQSGLLAGDVLLALGGVTLANYGDLVQALEIDGPVQAADQTKTLRYSRAGQTTELIVTLVSKA